MNGSAALECADPKSLGSTIGTGNLEVDLDKRLVMVDDNPVKLTQREYEILELLSSRKGTIVTKEMFLDRSLCRRWARAGAQDHRYLRL
jgi:DNA-binding response OmpR family regulator